MDYLLTQPVDPGTTLLNCLQEHIYPLGSVTTTRATCHPVTTTAPACLEKNVFNMPSRGAGTSLPPAAHADCCLSCAACLSRLVYRLLTANKTASAPGRNAGTGGREAVQAPPHAVAETKLQQQKIDAIVQRSIEEMLAVARLTSWNPKRFLTIAETMQGVSIGCVKTSLSNR